MNEEIKKIMETPENERTIEDFKKISQYIKEERKRLLNSGIKKEDLRVSAPKARRIWPEEYDKIKTVLKSRFYELETMITKVFESTITEKKPKGQEYISLKLSNDNFQYDLLLHNPKVKK